MTDAFERQRIEAAERRSPASNAKTEPTLDDVVRLLHRIAAAQVGMIDAIAAIRLELHSAAHQKNERLAAKRAAANHPFNPGTQAEDTRADRDMSEALNTGDGSYKP